MPEAAREMPPPAQLVTHASCPLCGGAPRPHLAATRDLHYGIAGSWTYQRCAACEVVFLNPAPTDAFLRAAYDDSYYSYQPFVLPARWKTVLRRLTGYDPGRTGDPVFRQPGRVLDIGCGSGAFLFRMKAAGWQTQGVEISERAADIGNTLHGLNIHAGTLASAGLPAAAFDYIRLNHSFEHLLDPLQTLDQVHRCLAPQGLLFIGVPNVDGLQARVFGRYWWNLGPPVHPFNYSRRTLRAMLERHGFEVLSSRTNSNFAGILGSLQMALNDRRGLRADTGPVFRNPLAKLLAHWLAKASDLFKAGDCLEIVARKRPQPASSHA